MKYRSRTEIVSMILEAANGGATKTKIMYKAFLSYAQLREYLSVLIENNLLEYLEGMQTYKTTEKGLNLLRMHNEIGELLQTPTRESRIIQWDKNRVQFLESYRYPFHLTVTSKILLLWNIPYLLLTSTTHIQNSVELRHAYSNFEEAF